MLFHPYGTNYLAGREDKEMVRLLSYSNAREGKYSIEQTRFELLDT